MNGRRDDHILGIHLVTNGRTVISPILLLNTLSYCEVQLGCCPVKTPTPSLQTLSYY